MCIAFKKKALHKFEKPFLSGWQDSNLRPPRPKRGAITGLRYTPNLVINSKNLRFNELPFLEVQIYIFS